MSRNALSRYRVPNPPIAAHDGPGSDRQTPANCMCAREPRLSPAQTAIVASGLGRILAGPAAGAIAGYARAAQLTPMIDLVA
ncbi:MAG: hypothetical protein EBZ50_01190 [Alphaproteobacteria bacterium]|nr:hypothetical protein [Alphaproteobacteria bacterium]